jgi:hypothetical protein
MQPKCYYRCYHHHTYTKTKSHSHSAKYSTHIIIHTLKKNIYTVLSTAHTCATKCHYRCYHHTYTKTKSHLDSAKYSAHMCILPSLQNTAHFKIIQTLETVFKDFLAVNWYQNQLKTVGPVPNILQSAVVL